MKENIVFIHGLTGKKRAFLKQMKYFSKEYNTFAYDLLGHGEDRGKPVQFTLENLVKQLEIFFEIEGIEQAHICSLSYGCYPSTIFAKKWGQKVCSLCYIGGHYNSPSPLLEVFRYYWDCRNENYALWLKKYSHALYPKKGIVDPYSTISRVVFHKFGLELHEGILREALEHRLYYDLRSDLKKISVPVLWVMGDHDFLYKSCLGDLKKLLPHMKYREIPHAGHAANLFQTNYFNRIYDRFLHEIRFQQYSYRS